MKQLQHNFTTAEQSKRLLELGVPANSADCYWNTLCQKPVPIRQGILYSDQRNQFDKNSLPIWSAGRLIEIMKICSIPVTTWYIKSDSKQSLIELFMDHLETSILERDIDFSKLEE